MLLKKSANREWVTTDYPGIERSLFRNNESGGRSVTDAVIFVSSQKATPVVEP